MNKPLLPSSQLISHFPLNFPPKPRIAYRVFRPLDTQTRVEQTLEYARRQVVKRWQETDDLLGAPIVAIDPKNSLIWTFVVGSDEDNAVAEAPLMQPLSFDSMTEVETESYSPSEVYPCSEACASLPKPCSNCPPSWSVRDQSSAYTLLPRVSLRSPHAFFLSAVRDRIVDTLCVSSRHNSLVLHKIPGGFIVDSSSDLGEWATGWEQLAQEKMVAGLVHLHLTVSGLLAQIVFRTSQFEPLPPKIESGCPIVLLPFATPAFYITEYVGNTSRLNEEFRKTLEGHGFASFHSSEYVLCWKPISDDAPQTPFLNREGHSTHEERGVVFMWPKVLCRYSNSRLPAIQIPSLSSTPMPSPPLTPTTLIPGSMSSLQRRHFSRSHFSLGPSAERVAVTANAFVEAIVRDRERVRDSQRSHENSPSKAAFIGALGDSPSISGPASPLSHTVLGTAHASLMHGQAYPSPPDLSPGPSGLHTHYSAQSSTHRLSHVHFPSHSSEAHPSQFAYSAASTPSSHPNIPSRQAESSYGTSLPTPAPFPSGQPPKSTSYMTSDSSAFSSNFGGVAALAELTWGSMNFPSGDDPPHAHRDGPDDLEEFGMITDDVFDFFDNPPPQAVSTVNLSQDFPIPSFTFDQASWTPPVSTEETFIPTATTIIAPSPSKSEMGGLSFSAIEDAVLPSPLQPQLSPDDVFKSHPFNSARRSWSFSEEINHELLPVRLNWTSNEDAKYHSGKFLFSRGEDTGSELGDVVPISSTPMDVIQATDLRRHYDNLSNPHITTIQKLLSRKRKLSFFLDPSPRSVRPRYSNNWRSQEDHFSEDSESDEASSESSADEDDNYGDLDDESILGTKGEDASMVLENDDLSLSPWLFNNEAFGMRSNSYARTFRTQLSPQGRKDLLGSQHRKRKGPPLVVSVPTPISPGDLAADAERTRSTQDAVFELLREAVDNSPWFNDYLIQSSCRDDDNDRRQAWTPLIGCVMQYIRKILSPGQPLDSATFAALPAFPAKEVAPKARAMSHPPVFETLDPPLFSLTQANSVIQVLSSGLRFWEKLGLGPLFGPKDVTAYALFEAHDSESSTTVKSWLDRLCHVYESRNYGRHITGHTGQSHAGILPIEWDNLRQSLEPVLQSNAAGTWTVLYIVAPHPSLTVDRIGSLSRLISAEKRVLLHLVPYRAVVDSPRYQTSRHSGLGAIASSIYNRLGRPVERVVHHTEPDHALPSGRAVVRAPTFVISRPIAPSFKYVLDWPVPAIDVMDRHSLLHVGYCLSPTNDRLLASCVDQRGEEYDVKVWNVGVPDSEVPLELKIAQEVFRYAISFAHRVRVEWKVIISKLGSMSSTEVTAWNKCLADDGEAAARFAPLHVSVLCVEQNSPPIFMSSNVQSPQSKVPAKAIPTTTPLFADASSSTYAIYPHLRIRMPSERELHFGEEVRNQGESTLPSEKDLGLLPICTAYLWHVPAGDQGELDCGNEPSSVLQINTMSTWASKSSTLGTWRRSIYELQRDYVANFNELATLARERWKFTGYGALPYHLVAVKVMSTLLDLQEGFDLH